MEEEEEEMVATVISVFEFENNIGADWNWGKEEEEEGKEEEEEEGKEEEEEGKEVEEEGKEEEEEGKEEEEEEGKEEEEEEGKEEEEEEETVWFIIDDLCDSTFLFFITYALSISTLFKAS